MTEEPSAADRPGEAAAPRRTGVEIAREALAAARLAARRGGARPVGMRGEPATPGSRRAYARGEELRSGPGPDDRDPQPVGSAVRRLLAERGWEVEAAVSGLLGRWPELVGPEVAAHATPERFDDGVLVVRADSTAWATQLRLLVPALRARIDAELGRGVCRAISVQGPAAPSWRRGPLSVRGRGPRDTYG
ncbi:DUF721 domain-containing protein [Motilibacter aurantiacus]|uniref:DUF721 domain-containing protein n=1 Tax=Motilibacter aurantiacus TaxID=2714955 RepID=UPI002F2B22D1